MSFSRRDFLFAALAGIFVGFRKEKQLVNTVNGIIDADNLGLSLIHEHFLVDFIGADKISPNRWNHDEVAKKVMPFLLEAKKVGVKSIFDCTPNFLGRDVALLQLLTKQTGLNIITNTGYYGARENKHLPSWALTESAEQLAARWVDEFENGIDGTSVKPGFIKIGVDANKDGLTEIHKKLVRSAALTHLKTGLTICSHTGPGTTAFEEIEIIQSRGLHPSAFVWVHAQAETDKTMHSKAARLGCWVSLDGIGWGDFDNYADSIYRLKHQKLLHRTLLSHDAGWYKPDEPEGVFQGYTNIFTDLIPHLKKNGFSEKEIHQLLVKNPADAMGIRVRRQ